MMQGTSATATTGVPQSGTDTGQFSGEQSHLGWNRDLKMKIGFVVLSILFVLGSAAYVRYRMEGMNLSGKANNAAVNQDSLAQRKVKIFDVDDAVLSKKPPIDLPPEVKPGLPPAFPGNAAPTVGLPIGLGNDDWQPRKPAPVIPSLKPMMLGDSSTGAGSPNGTTLMPGKGSTAAATTALDLGALLGLNANGSAKSGTEPPGSQASPTISSPGKAGAQTIEAQALIARERAGAQVTATAQVSASKLGRRSFVLSKGAFIPCVLETQLVSNVFGMASCVVTHNVYSDDGKVLLIERGSRVTGNYGSNLRNGDSRLAVIWDRIKTPKGVTVDVNSPATDGAGAMGVPGIVDKHWFERIAGAIMLSLIQDTIQYATSSIAYSSYLKEQREIANTQLPVQMGSTSSSTITTTSVDPVTGDTITTVSNSGQSPVAQAPRARGGNPPAVPVFGGTNTSKQGASIPEQVLSASINAAPTLTKNRGEVVYIFVANDLWFDRVYGLKE